MPKRNSQKKSKKSRRTQSGGSIGPILGVENPRIGGMAEVITQTDCPQVITASNQYGGKRKLKK